MSHRRERAREPLVLVYIDLSASLEGVPKGMFVRRCSESCIVKGCSERGVMSDGAGRQLRVCVFVSPSDKWTQRSLLN